MGFVFFSIVSFIFYLALTAAEGGAILYLWSIEEIVLGGFLSLLLSGLFVMVLPRKIPLKVLNPLNWILFLIYLLGPFLWALTLANLEVVYRVITGRFKPAIVKVETGLKSETGTVVLANSITLTPGTLSVDIDEENHVLYIHCLNWKKAADEKATPQDVSGPLHFWVKKIFG
jgi:multicomponent Na+:H+ antiporter subunit E